MHLGIADDTLSYEDTTLVVQGVPALICDSCGQTYFDEDVAQRLLDLAREAATAGVVVHVCRYVAA